MKYGIHRCVLCACAWLFAGSGLAQIAPLKTDAVALRGVAAEQSVSAAASEKRRTEMQRERAGANRKPGAVMGKPASAALSDGKGKTVYEQRRPASEGLAAVAIGGHWGFVDRQGREIIGLHYDDVWEFREGLAAVKKDGRWGFIDSSGRAVIALQYDNALAFSEGRAPVQKNGRWGFVDVSGREVITPRYDKVWPFEDGQAMVLSSGQHRYIDRNGQEVFPKKTGVAKPANHAARK